MSNLEPSWTPSKCGYGRKRFIELPGHRDAFNGAVADVAGIGRLCVFRTDIRGMSYTWLTGDFTGTSWPVPEVCGLHDPRLFLHCGRLWMMAVSFGWTKESPTWPRVHELIVKDGQVDFIEAWRFDGAIDGWPDYKKSLMEKNWCPFPGPNGELYITYSIEPNTILQLDIGRGKLWREHVSHSNIGSLYPLPGMSELRGNTNAVRLWDGSYLSTFHYRHNRGYHTGFYRFAGEPPFEIIEASNEPEIVPADAHGRCWRNPSASAGVIFPLSLTCDDDTLRLHGGDSDDSQIEIEFEIDDVLHHLRPVCREMAVA